MFNNGKIFSGPQKAKKHHSVGYYVFWWMCFIIEVLLGINVAFLVDVNLQVVAVHMMEGVTLLGMSLEPVAITVAFVISLAVAACFMMGGMWTFSDFLDSYRDAEEYERAEGTSWPWPRLLMVAFLLVVMALDFFTLQFRATYFASTGETALFAFFCVLIVMPFLLGCLIHVIENTPRDRRLTKAYNYAQQVATGDEERAVQYMTAGERDMYLSGNRDDAMASYYARTGQLSAERTRVEEERQADRQQRLAERAETRERRRNPFLKAVPPQAGQNGRSA